MDTARSGRAALEPTVDNVTRWAFWVIAVLIPIQLLIGFLKLVDHESWFSDFLAYFDVGEELTFPTWYSTMLLAAAGVGAIIAYRVVSERVLRRGYLLLAIVMFYLSLDDATRLHERASTLMHELFDLPESLEFAWVIPFSILAVILFVAFLPFLRAVSRTVRIGLVTAGILYVVVVLGLELLESAVFAANGEGNAVTELASLAEEVAEMVGAILVARVTFLVAIRHPQDIALDRLFMRSAPG